MIIKLYIGNVDCKAHPIFGSDFEVSSQSEENRIFRRTTISGKINFVNKDFDLFSICDESVVFTAKLYEGNTLLFSGEFTKSECSMDYDNKICSVEVEFKDRYEKIINALDTEYNLIDLAPVRESITMTKRAILQFYAVDSSKITSVIGKTSYETDCDIVEESELPTYGFSKLDNYFSFKYTDTNDPTIIGTYFGIINLDDGVSQTIQCSNGGYARYIYQSALNRVVFEFHETQSSPAYIRQGTNWSQFGAIWNVKSNEIKSYYLTQGSSTVHYISTFKARYSFIYGRLLSDVEDSNHKRPAEDIYPYNLNYKYVYDIQSISCDFREKLADSTTPTKWGKDDAGKYFDAPTLTSQQILNGDAMIALCFDSWNPMSYWLRVSNEFETSISAYDAPFVLNDAYPLYDCISKVLAKIDSSLSFGNGDQYSQFLNETTTLPSWSAYYPSFPRSLKESLYITPITNIKKTYYNQAAQKGNITLGQILDMLRMLFQCYWFIDGNKLRIEHISFFRNNKSYSPQSIVPDIDVTSMMCSQPKKNWGFGTNKIDSEKVSLPSRYDIAWSDSCTEPFNGYPIVITDKYVEDSNSMTETISNFISDIDLIISNPSELGDDLYAVFLAENTNKNVAIGNVRISNTKPIYSLQNVYMSIMYAMKEYYKYDLSGWHYTIDDVPFVSLATKPYMKQTIRIPLSFQNMQSAEIIKTSLGIGYVDSINWKFDDGIAEIVILHPNKENYIDYLSIDRGVAGDVITNNYNSALKIHIIYPIAGLVESTISAGQSIPVVESSYSIVSAEKV